MVNSWRQHTQALLIDLSDNPHYWRLMRSQRSYYESNGVFWSRLGLICLLIAVMAIPLPIGVYCLGFPIVLFALIFVISLDTTRFVYHDSHQIPYQLSTLTQLSANDVVEGYYQVSLYRLALLLGFPSRCFNWARAAIMLIWLVGCGRTLMGQDLSNLLQTSLFNGVWGAMGGFTFTIIMLVFYQVFTAIAIREGLKASTLARASIATTLENLKLFAMWLIAFFVLAGTVIPSFLMIASIFLTAMHVLTNGDIVAMLGVLLGGGAVNLLAVWTIIHISRMLRQDSVLWHKRLYRRRYTYKALSQ